MFTKDHFGDILEKCVERFFCGVSIWEKWLLLQNFETMKCQIGAEPRPKLHLKTHEQRREATCHVLRKLFKNPDPLILSPVPHLLIAHFIQKGITIVLKTIMLFNLSGDNKIPMSM